MSTQPGRGLAAAGQSWQLWPRKQRQNLKRFTRSPVETSGLQESMRQIVSIQILKRALDEHKLLELP